jgi:superfamily II DNA/RNA helicase
MSQNHTPSSALVRTAAVLAQAVAELDLAGQERDAYWTQVIYHNSLRELGKTVTFARDDIPARVEVIQPNPERRRTLRDAEVVELTSNVSSRQIPSVLARMAVTADNPDAISLLLATNMIQVGIDVPRLGLMLVNGQPKTTSEYIQASSRVGRGSTRGLVVTLYSPSKPRDRSHYESFFSYHAALYRYVEPSSVTPFALQSRNRSLHAALVILLRHGAGLRENDQAIDFDQSLPKVIDAVDVLLARVAAADPMERNATEAHIRRLLDTWTRMAEEARRDASRLHYYAAGRQHRRLLRRYGEVGEGWETLDSMRSVDRQCIVEVIGGTAGG